jgi:hypothetical protein
MAMPEEIRDGRTDQVFEHLAKGLATIFRAVPWGFPQILQLPGHGRASIEKTSFREKGVK